MLKIEGQFLRYELNLIENFGALSRDPKAAIQNLVSVKRYTNPWTVEVLRGIRAPGSGFPFLIMLGTMWHRRGRDFCVVYKRRPVLVLVFDGPGFKRWVIPDNEANRAVIRAANSEIDLPVLEQ